MKREKKELIFEDAEVLFPNFRGLPSEYNRAGDRNFNVVIRPSEYDPDMLQEEGWNVKVKTPKVNEGDSYYFLPVAVSFHPEGSGLEFLNPKVHLVMGEKMIDIGEDEIGQLDTIDAKCIDIIVSAGKPYDKRDGTEGVKAWLKEIYVVVDPNPLADKYRNYV